MNSLLYVLILILVILILWYAYAPSKKLKFMSECTPVPISQEMQAMTSYAVANKINYTTHPSGILYEIITQGSGEYPTLSSTINIDYVGKLLNNTTFDTETNIPLPLNKLIQGWQIALPLIQVGGRIKLIIPSSLAYGCKGAGDGLIPPNSPLYFDITLNSIVSSS